MQLTAGRCGTRPTMTFTSLLQSKRARLVGGHIYGRAVIESVSCHRRCLPVRGAASAHQNDQEHSSNDRDQKRAEAAKTI